jgi:hypothetical protein
MIWAYDSALAIWLGRMITVAAERVSDQSADPWLDEQVQAWRIAAAVPDVAFSIGEGWTGEQINMFAVIGEAACDQLERAGTVRRNDPAMIGVLDDYDVIWRGDDEQSTDPIVELGKAIISLLRGDLSGDVSGIDWIYGTPEGAHRF